jgi:hypothetical protein
MIYSRPKTENAKFLKELAAMVKVPAGDLDKVLTESGFEK